MAAASQAHGFLDSGKPPAPPGGGVPGRRQALIFLLPGILFAAGALLGRGLLTEPPAALPRPGPRRYPLAYRPRRIIDAPGPGAK